eukprot:TRINITY_DN6699_c0_g1_i2.p1 TRINITY_DN6699_c0_g1~~TRINITY_DN6699_c0_g1_i2.p1  ORF type:complete len:972 (-),score=215.66 TRINITY_DN6699_c0_g1_i2:574-3489(-)
MNLDEERSDESVPMRSAVTLPVISSQTPIAPKRLSTTGTNAESSDRKIKHSAPKTHRGYHMSPRERIHQPFPRSARNETGMTRFPSVVRSSRAKLPDGLDVEFLLEQVRQLKITNTQLKEEKTKLQTKVYRLETEIKKLQKTTGNGSHLTSHAEDDDDVKPMKPRPPLENGKNLPLNPIPHGKRPIKQSDDPSDNEDRHPSAHHADSGDHYRDSLQSHSTSGRQPRLPSLPMQMIQSLIEATNNSRSNTPKSTKTQRTGVLNSRQRQSIALVFGSSSTLVGPHTHRQSLNGEASIDISGLNATSREKSKLSEINLEAISWKDFSAWFQKQDPALQVTTVKELFYVIKGSKKVFEIATQISFSQTVEEVVDRFKDGSKDILGADEVHLFVLDGEGLLSAVYTEQGAKPPPSVIGQGIIGQAAETGEAINCRDVNFDERYSPETDKLPQIDVKSILAVPLSDRDGQTFGVSVAYKHNDSFSREDEVSLQVLTDQASNNMQLFKFLMKTVREEKKNKAISEVLKAVNDETATFDHVVDTIIRVTYDVMQVDRVSFFLVDNIAKQLLLKVSKDNVTIRVPIGSGIAGTVAATGETINIPDAYADPRFDRSFDDKTGFRTRTILCLPIFDNNKKPIAVIQVLNKAHGVFQTEDEELLKTFTAEAASVIQRQSLETAYHNLVASSDSSAADTIKDLLGEYSGARRIIQKIIKPKMKFAKLVRQMTSSRIAQAATYSKMLRDWNLDHFAYSDDELCLIMTAGFESLELLTTFKVDYDVMRNFLQVVRSNYQDNPYHNFQHAFSVFQCAYIIITTTDVGAYLTPLDIFGLLVACICHDVDHPGTNNAFLMNSNSPLAIVYNDISILENHHSSLTFRIIQDEKTNIFHNIDASDRVELRRTIIPAILSTDMAEHSKLTTNLSVHNNTFQREKKEDRQFLVNIILHSSDLCNPVLPTERAYVWASRVLQEFNEQVRILVYS